MNFEYVVIQAGGLGSRLEHLTKNKPKGIVPINNLPIIFHLFQKFPDKKFIIIADYKHEVLQKYLDAFAKVRYIVINAEGKGTCGGIGQSLKCIEPNKPFLLIWSDLILSEKFSSEKLLFGNYVGISKQFPCRWSYSNELGFIEEPSSNQGVAGLFLFTEKSLIEDVPISGEFVKWLQNSNIEFNALPLLGTREVGTLDAINQMNQNDGGYRCRPFNSLEIQGNTIIKKPITEQGKQIAEHEINWYKEVAKYDYNQIPHIYSYNPLIMDKIDGKNIYDTKLSIEQKKQVIDNLVSSLEKLHNYKHVPCDIFSLQDTYINKTFKRINPVRDLIPFAYDKLIVINGKKCRNIFFEKEKLREKIKNTLYDTDFALIHGDCTFCNTLIDKDLNIIFIDPRGYFGDTILYGDVYYDWAKVYYSIQGDYDQFNNKNFEIHIDDDKVTLNIETNGWRDITDYYLSKIPNCNVEKIKLLHALIWLSLTTYAWEDYDSVCGAFYNGLYYLEDIL